MSQGYPDNTRRSVAANLYEVVAGASNNAASIKGSAGVVTGWYCYNAAASARFVKFYDKASSPTPGSDTPVWVLGIPALSGCNVALIHPLGFNTGIAIAIVAGIANNDNTSTAASDVVASVAYI